MEAHDCHYGTPLHVACARAHYDCAKVLLNSGESWILLDTSVVRTTGSVPDLSLIHQGANVNAAKLHETALHHAAKSRNIDLIQLLVEFGGNVFARDNLNKKPMDYTSSGSPPYLCLSFYESKSVSVCASCPFSTQVVQVHRLKVISDVSSSSDTPLSLQQISRVALRRILGIRALDVISKLGLPNRIVTFLSYTPPPVIEL